MADAVAVTSQIRKRKSVGQPLPQIDSAEKVKGLTQYLQDLSVPGMLYGAIVRSAIPHGLIREIDTSRAERLSGVRAVITARDCPGVLFGPQEPQDWEILCRNKVRYIGDEVAAVAAISPDVAKEAAALVRVEYQELPAVYDPFEALKPGAPVLWEQHPDNVAYRFHIERGDLEAGFARADDVFEHDFYTGRFYHGQMEPMGCIVQYHADGGYTIWTPTHLPFRSRMTYSKGLGVSMDKIRIVVPPFGGSFGMKYELNINCIAALLSKKSRRPVKIFFEREEDIGAGHPRMGLHFHYRLGVTRDGRFVAKEARVVGTGGARTFWTPPVLSTACYRIDSLYHFQNVRTEGFLVYTNQSPATCFRGFGNAEALTALETFIDEIGERTGIDPVELRRMNGVKAGDVSLHGWRIASCGLRECLDRAESVSGFRNRKPPPKIPPRRGVVRGIGLAAGHHISGNRIIINEYDGASAQVRLGFDGQVAVIVGEPDIGQGMNTVFAQIAAEVLDVDPASVRSLPIDTLVSPHGVGTLGSRGTTVAGRAVQLAAEDARTKLVSLAAELLGVPPQEIRLQSGSAVVASGGGSLSMAELGREYATRYGGAFLIGHGHFTPPTEIPDATKYGNLSTSYVFGTHVAEVEVDTETGATRVVRYWALHDSGTIINPSTATGQVHGGVAQGIASALLEEVLVKDGRVTNPNFLDYRIPGFQDIPEMYVEFVETKDPYGPFGAKSIGESSLNPTAAAVCNAIYNAVGVRVHQTPVTPERLWKLLETARTEARKKE
ncbi:MAG: xanthine dehydrogenase family protein molybdopterin-binding subunit [Acidobacteria bacterium]|nr:xanthine dehydrogenase family protein molybdopterin-binding subunit [Acidobacteriota bacterium]